MGFNVTGGAAGSPSSPVPGGSGSPSGDSGPRPRPRQLGCLRPQTARLAPAAVVRLSVKVRIYLLIFKIYAHF